MRAAISSLLRSALRSSALLSMSSALGLLGCEEERADLPAFAVDATTLADLQTLSEQRVFFGHHSVGANIMKGVEELERKSGSAILKIAHVEAGASLPAASFLEGPVGANRDPRSKFDAFARLLDGELAGKVDVALMKLCYVDVDRNTDVDRVFGDYVSMIEGLKARHPDVTFVHVTTPLMVKEGWSRAKYLVKTVLGVENDNIKRNAYNAKLRARFRGEPIFDLEAVESTRPDGSRETFDDGAHFALVPEYSVMRAYLNEEGRLRVARELVRVLARAPGRGGAATE